MKKRILIVGCILAMAGLAYFVWQGKARATASETLKFYGNVDIREVNLGFRVPGRIAVVLKDEGDSVKAGEVLARLDDEPYERELDKARAQAASAAARLDLVQAGYRTQEIAQASAVLREREVTRENAEKVYNRMAKLFSEKSVSVQERDDAEARFREAEARLNSARQQLALLEAGFRPEEVEQARAEAESAQAAVALAEVRLHDAVLLAPTNGVILTRVHEPGAIVQAGATVLSLSLSDPVWVRAYIDESRLGKIHPGMKVSLFTDTRPDKPYSGQVGYISPRAEFTPKTVETPELRTSLVYRFRVVVSDPDDSLRQGMPVTIVPGE